MPISHYSGLSSVRRIINQSSHAKTGLSRTLPQKQTLDCDPTTLIRYGDTSIEGQDHV